MNIVTIFTLNEVTNEAVRKSYALKDSASSQMKEYLNRLEMEGLAMSMDDSNLFDVENDTNDNNHG